MSTAPTTQQWKDLYEAAGRYKQAAIWRWMSNSHLFGVRDQASGKIGYCSVFGNGGELFGMAIYLGSGGLRTLTDMLAGKLAEDPMFSQHCLLFSFDDREDLKPSEYKRIKALGLRYRGRQAWPTFRLYEPGYLPWPELTAEQAVFMRHAVDQAMIVGQAYRSQLDDLLYEEGGKMLVRETCSGTDAALVWHTVSLVPDELPEEEGSDARAAPLNELRVTKALRGTKGVAGVWEADSFHVPMPVQEGEKPFYPKMSLIVDQTSGQILKFALTRREEAAAETADNLLSLIEELKLLPREIWVGSEATGDALLPLAEALKLELMLAPKLPALSEAREAMERQFM
ncbi:DUF6930 domain-containing protein [Cohnella sp. GCM10020058]|uniref:DUF7309 domain-containing protein n=1 Tax=Cohnella sp. GCM10020058 TaxID=3317330 RepID=UPI003630DA82